MIPNPNETFNGVATGVVANYSAVKYSADATPDAHGFGKPQFAQAADPTVDHFAGVALLGCADGEDVSVIVSGIAEITTSAKFTRAVDRWATYDANGLAMPHYAGAECIGEVIYTTGMDVDAGLTVQINMASRAGNDGVHSKSGHATIPAGTAEVSVIVPAGASTRAVTVTPNQPAEDATAIRFWVEWVDATTLKIHANANATADVVLAYAVN